MIMIRVVLVRVGIGDPSKRNSTKEQEKTKPQDIG